MSSVFTKTVAVDWTDGVSSTDLPALAVIGVFATAGMLLSQASYRGAGLAAPLATLTVVNPVVAAAVGITMFGETFRYGTTGTALALSCGVVAAGGLILLTTERMARAAVQAAAPEEPAEPVTGPTPVGELAGPTPVEQLLAVIPERPATAALREEVLVPAQAGPTILAVAYDQADAEPADPARYRFYGPFYGGSYVPMPGHDRHRERVRS